MMRLFTVASLITLICLGANAQTRRRHAGTHAAPVAWNEANMPFSGVIAPGDKGPQVLRAQILLDRASFSPGEIDASYGPNFRSAFQCFQKAHHQMLTEELGPETF